ncbi:hypothetical protein PUR59_30605 [Streptomyces sp. SP18ES09]|uniref:hypothetical protein n=1 Tax=Streptomyces sp. SP18ES09 TaxID=3002532 RepID=UPI002E77D496|nr:hypothetical protein [Streptomyces sp. SP18ES09]MEE1819353.1 hypothetical protein [Streptomyces sp. SP18ES09]
MSRVSQPADEIVEFGVAIPFEDVTGPNVLIVRTSLSRKAIAKAAAKESPEARVYSRVVGDMLWTEAAA